MNHFERKLAEVSGREGLYGETLDTLQVNLGFKCNLRCRHCHLEASPEREEAMDWPVMEQILSAVEHSRCRLVDLTGGSPELNASFCRFVTAIRERGCPVQVRTNLTLLVEPGMENLPEFFKERQVRLVASLPCYTAENVSLQRGDGVFERSIEGIRRLNAFGYGCEAALPLNLLYNPGGPFLPPLQTDLEADYRRELADGFGISFTRLLTLTNMPLGRFQEELRSQGKLEWYRRLLRKSFNPGTVPGLMCRRQVSVGWEGTLYDCDFNLALGLPLDHGAPDHIGYFTSAALKHRRIVTGNHCFGCTAGAGSS
ncbi:MAG: radical SAM/Cys-rich domain protein [Syntrophobacteraceae bacterium]|nr:radical SAM/Cys-rich domain protein [Syntrophobacteraceae bacterium]